MQDPISEPFIEAIRALNGVFEAFGGQGIVIGGIAVSLLANPRYTQDIDGLLVLDTAEAGRLLDVAAAHDFEPRFPGMLEVARQARIVALRHRPTGVLVDIALGILPFEEEVLQRATDCPRPVPHRSTGDVRPAIDSAFANARANNHIGSWPVCHP